MAQKKYTKLSNAELSLIVNALLTMYTKNKKARDALRLIASKSGKVDNSVDK